MTILKVLTAAATLALAAPAWAQTPAPVDCAKTPAACHPAAAPTNKTTEPVSSDPMYPSSDKLTAHAPASVHPQGQPPSYHSSSMPSGAALPSGTHADDPMAPAPMPGSGR
jgi:hypothetical protein